MKKYFERHHLILDIVKTEYSGHAEKIARDASSQDYDCIIGAGGDGTINEVLNGIIGSGKRMGIIPWGTANVFTREMRFPTRLRRICRLIRNGHSLNLDAARCNDRYFLLMCGVGFDAYSLKQIENLNLKKKMGIFAYIFGGFKAFSKYKFPEMTVIIDEKTQESGSFVLVSNTSRYTNYFSITLQAFPIDGLLDVFIYKTRGRIGILSLLLHLVKAALNFILLNNPSLFFKRIAFYRAKKIQISSKEKVCTQLDGELASNLPVSIDIIPHTIDCILPNKTIKKYIKIMRKLR